MHYKKKLKTKTARLLTGVLTLGIVVVSAFAGEHPAGAAAGDNSGKSDRQSVPEGKIYGSGTYIYDENPDEGYWLDQEDKDRDGKEDKNKKTGDKVLYEEYAASGITRKGGAFYYQGKRVKVIKDESSASAVYRFDPKLKGSVSIRITRNAKGDIKRVSYISRKEAKRLIKRSGLKAEKKRDSYGKAGQSVCFGDQGFLSDGYGLCSSGTTDQVI